ncbi:MAG: hypothetical protein IPJ34_03795 [Myxococcales bacterium]|nr:hypothetical protein [Myxococcales bacterium]
MRLLPLFVLAASLSALGCGPKKHSNTGGFNNNDDLDLGGPKPKDEMRKGVADENTWELVPGYGTKIKIPAQWGWAQKGALVAAFHKGTTSGLVVLGAPNTKDAIAKGKEARETLKLQLGDAMVEKGVRSKVNGLDMTRWDYEHAVQEGTPSAGVLIVVEVPKGFVVLLAYVHNGANTEAEELREALNSLSAEGAGGGGGSPGGMM